MTLLRFNALKETFKELFMGKKRQTKPKPKFRVGQLVSIDDAPRGIIRLPIMKQTDGFMYKIQVDVDHYFMRNESEIKGL